MWVVSAPEGAVARLLGIGFLRAAVVACVRAERAIADAEAALEGAPDAALARAIDDAYGLVTHLSDGLADLEATEHAWPDAAPDPRRAPPLRATFLRLRRATDVLRSRVREGPSSGGRRARHGTSLNLDSEVQIG
jgi:hypothetical protein